MKTTNHTSVLLMWSLTVMHDDVRLYAIQKQSIGVGFYFPLMPLPYPKPKSYFYYDEGVCAYFVAIIYIINHIPLWWRWRWLWRRRWWRQKTSCRSLLVPSLAPVFCLLPCAFLLKSATVWLGVFFLENQRRKRNDCTIIIPSPIFHAHAITPECLVLFTDTSSTLKF